MGHHNFARILCFSVIPLFNVIRRARLSVLNNVLKQCNTKGLPLARHFGKKFGNMGNRQICVVTVSNPWTNTAWRFQPETRLIRRVKVFGTTGTMISQMYQYYGSFRNGRVFWFHVLEETTECLVCNKNYKIRDKLGNFSVMERSTNNVCLLSDAEILHFVEVYYKINENCSNDIRWGTKQNYSYPSFIRGRENMLYGKFVYTL